MLKKYDLSRWQGEMVIIINDFDYIGCDGCFVFGNPKPVKHESEKGINIDTCFLPKLGCKGWRVTLAIIIGNNY